MLRVAALDHDHGVRPADRRGLPPGRARLGHLRLTRAAGSAAHRGARRGAGRRPGVRLSRFSARLAGFTGTSEEAPVPPGTVDLSLHRPDLDGFPIRIWRRLMAGTCGRSRRRGGRPADRGAGYEPLRRQIAGHLRRARAVRCEAGQVLVVSGSQQALDLCARVLLDPGDVVGDRGSVLSGSAPAVRRARGAAASRARAARRHRGGGACRTRRAWCSSRRRTSCRRGRRCRCRGAWSCSSGRAAAAPSCSRTTTTASTTTAARRCRRCRA